MANPTISFDPPFRDQLTGPNGMLSNSWEWFFRAIRDLLSALGSEKNFAIVNNTAVAADVTGLKFGARGVSFAAVDFCIQRITTSTGATELVEAGMFVLSYNPTSEDWNLTMIGTPGPDDSGVDFTVTATGQVKYTASNITGTASISRVFWRARTLAGKHTSYSDMGAR